ncbi:MAG: hypothetical protein Q9166_003097 [cf. Caloplaca sp. 2 TL-2023]
MRSGLPIRLRTLFAVSSVIGLINAFYIPGFSIKSYVDDEAIPLQVNKVYSDRSQLQYAYYDLPFVCPPTGKKHAGYASGRSISLNLGEVLRGDRIMTSDYDIAMGQDQECQYLCSHRTDRQSVKRARELIEEGYVAEWIVDNLPGATSFVTVDRTHKYYAAGFKIGYKDFSPVTGKQKYYINNHITLVIRYRQAPGRAGRNGGKVIVGFEVYTKSIEAAHRDSTGCPQDLHSDMDGMEMYIAPNNTNLASKYPSSSYLPDEDDVDDGSTLTIPYSYSVYFREDESIDWSKRWDLYFNNQEDSNVIHWLAIINSLVICSLLTVIVIMVINRTYRQVHGKDGPGDEGKLLLKRRKPTNGTKSPRLREKAPAGLLEQKGELERDEDWSSDEEYVEDITGWKLLHGDIFRAPPYAGYLAPLIGSGMQLVFMATGLLILSCFGILNPSFRGGFVSVGVGLFVFAGIISGYFSSRLYKTFGGMNWRKNTLMTALLFPGLLFTTIFILNLFVWAQASSTALPFGTLVGLIALMLLIQLPLVYVGSWYGFHQSQPYEHPTKTNSIARPIPEQAWYTQNVYAALIAGFIPFAVVFIELLFVFRSLWQDKSGYYYVFGFLSIVSLVGILTVVEVTIVAIYIMLCQENYNWWWQSVFIGGGSSFWIFLYCIVFYYTKLKIHGFISGLLFFSYSFLACTVYGLLTGTVGFLTAYAFVRRIYGYVSSPFV